MSAVVIVTGIHLSRREVQKRGVSIDLNGDDTVDTVTHQSTYIDTATFFVRALGALNIIGLIRNSPGRSDYTPCIAAQLTLVFSGQTRKSAENKAMDT